MGEGPGREGTISTWSKWARRACRCIPKQHKGALVCAWVRGWVLQGFSCLPRGRTGEEGTLVLCCPKATSTLPRSNQATRARHNLGTGTRRASTSRGPLPICSNAHVGGSTARTRNRRRAWRGECMRIGAREHAEWCFRRGPIKQGTRCKGNVWYVLKGTATKTTHREKCVLWSVCYKHARGRGWRDSRMRVQNKKQLNFVHVGIPWASFCSDGCFLEPLHFASMSSMFVSCINKGGRTHFALPALGGRLLSVVFWREVATA